MASSRRSVRFSGCNRCLCKVPALKSHTYLPKTTVETTPTFLKLQCRFRKPTVPRNFGLFSIFLTQAYCGP